MNVFTLLAQAAERHGDLPAVFSGTTAIHTWASLARRALALAAGLQVRGLAGERIVVCSENQPAYLELLFGIWAAGAAAVPVNAKLHPREVLQIIDDAQASLVLVSAALAPALAAEAGRTAPPLLVIGSPEVNALAEAAPPLPRAAEVAPDSLAWLFFTSGTTGRSKGAMLTHRNLWAATLAHLADIEVLTPNDSQLHAAPMSHGSGLYILPSVARGTRQVVPASGGFDPAEFLALCSAHPGCGAFLAPTMVHRLRVEAERSGARPTNLRCIVYGGGPMYVEDLKRAIAVFGPVFAQIYGQGESPMTITGLTLTDHAAACAARDDAVLGSVGRARTGCEVAVVDAAGQRLPVGEIGEVVVRGDTVMQGYWRHPAGTAEALRKGWLYTGDMGTLDARGFLTLRDRSKDVVISGGSNIYPREVEEVLLTHPGVAEACVVGQADAEWGEVVVAFVVPNRSTAIDAEALDRHCLAHIARFKRPKRYHLVDALPKNAYGKVLRRELRERLRASTGG